MIEIIITNIIDDAIRNDVWFVGKWPEGQCIPMSLDQRSCWKSF